jgi:hypothetical protein
MRRPLLAAFLTTCTTVLALGPASAAPASTTTHTTHTAVTAAIPPAHTTITAPTSLEPTSLAAVSAKATQPQAAGHVPGSPLPADQDAASQVAESPLAADQKVAGQEVTGQEAAGQEVTAQGVSGQEVTGQAAGSPLSVGQAVAGSAVAGSARVGWAAPVGKRLAVVVIQNGDTSSERAQLADTGYLRQVFFGGSGSLATWMPAASFGQLSYPAAGDGVFKAEPSVALRDASRSGCHTDLARATAEQHLAGLGIGWDALAIVYDIANCGWGGLGQLPGKITWYPPKPSLSAIVHEIGHNQGYPHQSKRDCPGGDLGACKTNGYSGNTPMGSGGAGRGYSSAELLHSGWIQPGWRAEASKPGSFSLKPLYSAPAVSGTRIVEYRASPVLSYLAETRAPANGMDSAISNPGVRVYAVTVNASSGVRDYKNALLINPGSGSSPYLPAGATLTDSANKIRITVRSASASGAQIAVESLAPKPPASSRPSVSPSSPVSPSPTPSPSATDSVPATLSPVPDETVLENVVGSPPSSQPPVSRTLLFAGSISVLILLAAGAVVLRPTRAKPRHRRESLFSRLAAIRQGWAKPRPEPGE